MNNERRKTLKEITDNLETAMDRLREVAQEESFEYDSLPENVQNSERGAKMDVGVSMLNYAADDLSEIIDTVNEVLGE